MKVRFSPASRQDLREIARWITADRPNAARKVVEDLRTACYALAERPRAYDYLAGLEQRGVRRAPYSRYLICYQLEADVVAILRILDGAQDTTDLL